MGTELWLPGHSPGHLCTWMSAGAALLSLDGSEVKLWPPPGPRNSWGGVMTWPPPAGVPALALREMRAHSSPTGSAGERGGRLQSLAFSSPSSFLPPPLSSLPLPPFPIHPAWFPLSSGFRVPVSPTESSLTWPKCSLPEGPSWPLSQTRTTPCPSPAGCPGPAVSTT